MRMASHHSAQEGDWLCVPPINVLWCEMCVIDPVTKAKHPVKMLAEAGKRVTIHSEASSVLTQAARPLRKKPQLQKQQKSYYNCKCTQGQRPEFLETCPDGTKTELFGHNDHCYI